MKAGKESSKCKFPIILVSKKAQKAYLTDAFYGCEKVKKICWLCDLFIFKRQCIYNS